MSASAKLREMADYTERFGDEYVALRPPRARLVADCIEALERLTDAAPMPPSLAALNEALDANG